MNKTYRQGQILRLIRSKKIHTQEALASELGALDVRTTQVTLSRDIRDLGLVKTPAVTGKLRQRSRVRTWLRLSRSFCWRRAWPRICSF